MDEKCNIYYKSDGGEVNKTIKGNNIKSGYE